MMNTTDNIKIQSNPILSRTHINFSLSRQSKINISIIDGKGEIKHTLIDDVVEAGNHSLTWSGNGNPERNMPCGGSYMLRFERNNMALDYPFCLFRDGESFPP